MTDSDIKLALLRENPSSMDRALQCAERERVILEGANKRQSVEQSHASAAVASPPQHNTYQSQSNTYQSPPTYDNSLGVTSTGFTSRGQTSRGRTRGRGARGHGEKRTQSEEAEAIRQQIAQLTARLGDLGTTPPTHESTQGRGRGGRRQPRGACWSCGGFGHYQAVCPNYKYKSEN